MKYIITYKKCFSGRANGGSIIKREGGSNLDPILGKGLDRLEGSPSLF